SERQSAQANVRRIAADAEAAETALRLQRAGLLGGEPTAEHRTRHNQARLDATAAFDEARDADAKARAALEGASARRSAAQAALDSAADRARSRTAEAEAALASAGLDRGAVEALLAVSSDDRATLRQRLSGLEDARGRARALVQVREAERTTARQAADDDESVEMLEQAWQEVGARFEDSVATEAALADRLREDDERRRSAAALQDEVALAERDRDEHAAVCDAIGSADGSRFRRIAQRITLRALVQYANAQLEVLAPRYRLAQTADESLGLWVVDQDMGEEIRSTRSLSGGERFLVSLALALALSGLEGRGAFVQTLFIDEGFGALDASTLDAAVDALEALQSGGRQVGVITHVRAMIDRIAAQVRVEKEGGGRSRVVVAEAA
ncbi:MAG: chromosome segregation protein SMC, partial [Hyphomicrobiales bacterium]|nr:chromosome segregation protein SMC [Hyphomicrobiales bacterium]